MRVISHLIILISVKTIVSITISCRNEKGAPTDWFINYKIPKLEDHDRSTWIGQGLGYAYLLPKMKKWVISSSSIGDVRSMVGSTFKEFYSKQKDLTYLLYNDDPPDNIGGTSVGHTKGAVVFDNDTGFWLIHSVPRFMSPESYKYPNSGTQNGQSLFCITFKIESLNEIGKQLLYNAPLFYDKNLVSSVASRLDDDVKSLFTDKPKFIRRSPFIRITDLKSRGGMNIKSFAKDNQQDDDLYSELIAPNLKTSLHVETWRRGSGTPMDPSCKTTYQVNDVETINMTVIDSRKTINLIFSYTEDHSKWAASVDQNWICIGDINRMESQRKRGGGSACISSTAVRNAFNSAISRVEPCPIKKNARSAIPLPAIASDTNC